MRLLPALTILTVSLPLSLGACKGSSKVLPATLPVVTLPADDMEAGRALGKAAATEKDPTKLAATIVAFLDRLHVPVVSEKGDKLIAQGKLELTTPHRLWFWEPVIVGAARATVLGDSRSLQEVLLGFGHMGDPKRLAGVAFGEAMQELAAYAGKKSLPVFGPIAAAITEDLNDRKQQRAHPRLDPVVTLLFGILMAVEHNAEREHPLPPPPPEPAPSASAVKHPGAPPLPYTLPNIPGLPPNLRGRTVHALGMGGPGAGPGGSAPCKWSGLASSTASSVFDGAGSGLGWVQSGASAVGISTPALSKLLGEIAPALGAASIAEEVTDGLAGMGIAAFVTADGDVSPTKVAYGDGPAKYTVHVKSDSPFDKGQLDELVSCLEASSSTLAGSAIENLRNLPPKGGVANAPVLWTGTDQYDPKHGTFTPNNASVPDGAMASLVKAGMQAVGGGATDASGESNATFQVKPKKSDSKASKIKRFTIDAEVFPFPPGTSVVNAGANALFSREVPIALEVEVPLGDWTLTVHWANKIQPPVTNVYFEDDGNGTVSFKLDPNDLSFHAKGSGTHTLSIPSQTAYSSGPGSVTCQAPVGPQPVDIALDGKVTSYETMEAQMQLTITPSASREAMNISCTATALGYSRSASKNAQARTAPLTEDFTIVLDDGETKDIPIDRMGGPMHITGNLDAGVSSGGGS